MANLLQKAIDKVTPAVKRVGELQAQGLSPDEARAQASKEFGFEIRKPDAGPLGKVVGTVGDVVKTAAPLSVLIPGVGPAAAAGIAALGGLAGKANDEGGLKGTKVLKDLALPAALSFAGGTALEKLTGAAGGAAGGAAAEGGKSGVGGVLNSVLNALTTKGEDGKTAGLSLLGKLLLGGGLTGLSLADASKQRKENQEFTQAQLELQRKGLEMAEKDLAAREPLRAKAIERLTNRQPGNDIFTGFFNQPSAARKQLREALLNARS